MRVNKIRFLAAVFGLTGVAAGAFGAHGLEDLLVRLGREANLAERAEWFDTAVRYQMYHALALCGLAAFDASIPRRIDSIAAVAFTIGLVLFSGSLFAMTFAGDAARKLGAITPLGGLALLVGWGGVAVGAFASKQASN